MAAAAFYDLEGTLVSTNLVHTLGFYAKNQQGLFRTFTKSASTLLSLPIFAATDQYSRKVFNDLFFKRYKGESEDRLRFFAEELFADVLKPAIFPGAFELIEKSRSLGLRQVVVTGALDLSVTPLMKYLGIEDYVTNRLEFVNGVATGRLLPPVVAAATKASWIRTFAEREGLLFITIADLIRYRRKHEKLVRRLAEAPIPTEFGEFRCIAFESVLNGDQHLAFVRGDVQGAESVLVRVHSECLTGDVFGSLRCDCGPA